MTLPLLQVELELMGVPRASVFFDLDDTLYLERDFARSGFVAAGAWLEKEVGVHGLAELCQGMFEAGQRSRIFDDALGALGLASDPALVGLLAELYRTHEPTIALAPDAVRYLASGSHNSHMGLITDGPHGTQRAKVRALALDDKFELIVYTDTLGPGCGKPHPRAFELVEEWASPDLPLVYVGDNPRKDFVAPRARGWWTVQLDRPERANHFTAPDTSHEAHARIFSLDDLDECLDRLLWNCQPVGTDGRPRASAPGLVP